MVTYPIAPIDDAKHADAARSFVAYVLSDEGQAILEKNGFVRVRE